MGTKHKVEINDLFQIEWSLLFFSKGEKAYPQMAEAEDILFRFFIFIGIAERKINHRLGVRHQRK